MNFATRASTPPDYLTAYVIVGIVVLVMLITALAITKFMKKSRSI